MKLNYLHIQNFKSVHDMEICDIGQALILVGKNNTGKTVVLDAIRLLTGSYSLSEYDFNQSGNITVGARFMVTEDDLHRFNLAGLVSQYKRYDLWYREFCKKLPSYKDDELSFEMTVNKNGSVRFGDGVSKNNDYIRQVLPAVHYIDTNRNYRQIESDIAIANDDDWLRRLKDSKCMFDTTRNCIHCFECIGKIEKKSAAELNVFEAAKLFEYRLYCSNIGNFEKTVNTCFHKNGGTGQQIKYLMNFSPSDACKVRSYVYNTERGNIHDMDKLSTGMRSIYILSLLEAYIESEDSIPSIILMEDPEIFLHPELQRIAGEILYRLGKKNQVIFTTHSPSMLFNFTKKQIRQIVMDKQCYSVARDNVDIGVILNDLGYTANDLMNVNFVFIVEGRQDKCRLPLLLRHYYHEVYDEEGHPQRIAIITTNSCTNIKTYANLKYINQVYLKDNFLMIRDGDGKNHDELVRKLCGYYNEKDDIDKLPKVTDRNVLVLKYYSFENYFLNPKIMVSIGIIESEDDFYHILYSKWQEYLYRLESARNMYEKTGLTINSEDDIRDNIETIKIYMRGHNLFDIFYGRYRDREQKLLQKYIELAPPSDFEDILSNIDKFVYFENRKN